LDVTELYGHTLFDAEFVIGHRGNTVPERSGVALSFRGRPPTPKLVIRLQHPPQGNTRSEQMTVHEKHFEHCLDLIIVLTLRSLLR
jgi:hypothetical protein